jgi:hypothetical protein
MPSSGKGQETSFRVRETPDWKKHAADLEAEMIKRRSVMAGNIEEHTGRVFGPGEWTKIALTEKQVKASSRLQGLSITKLDNRNKPAKVYEAIECEALGQGVLVRLIRKHLDSLLPGDPLEVIREREERQRVRTLAALKKIAKGGAK